MTENSFSEIVEVGDVSTTSHFTNIEIVPTSGFSLLARARRYGRWWMLKGLKPDRHCPMACISRINHNTSLLGVSLLALDGEKTIKAKEPRECIT